MFNILIKSHSYTINLANVLSIREYEFPKIKSDTGVMHDGMIGTLFVFPDDYAVRITCPYDEVMKQLTPALTTTYGDLRIIELEY